MTNKTIHKKIIQSDGFWSLKSQQDFECFTNEKSVPDSWKTFYSKCIIIIRLHLARKQEVRPYG